MDSMKRQDNMMLKDEPPQDGRCLVYYWGKVEGEYSSSSKNEAAGPKQK